MPNRKDGDYPVGFKKPPRQTRFQPGQSGNPKGRPKGSKNFATLFIQALFARVTVRENGRLRSMTKRKAIVTQVVNKAVLGNPRATQIVLDKMPEIERHHPSYFSPLIHDELLLDGNSRQNLATFCTTWIEPEVQTLMAECIDKNMCDKDEYPQTAELGESLRSYPRRSLEFARCFKHHRLFHDRVQRSRDAGRSRGEMALASQDAGAGQAC